jgi:malate dehydrogenase
MAGILDTGRYRAFVAEALGVSPKDVHALLLGSHGDTMVPLPRYTSVAGIPLPELLNSDEIDRIVTRTRNGGGELVNLMGTSAWYAPGAAAAQMVEAIVDDQKAIYPVCTLLKGEYGLKDIYLGVPVKLGANGIEEIIELKLEKEEMRMLNESAESVRNTMKILDEMQLF